MGDRMKNEKCGGAATPRWFGYALQSLVYLSHHACNQSRCPSGEIALKICTEATLTRRILALLAKADIVEAREGRDGGYALRKSPDTITLAEVYRALHIVDPLFSGMMDTANDGAIGTEVKPVFMEVVRESEKRLMDVLERRTIADLIRDVYGLQA